MNAELLLFKKKLRDALQRIEDEANEAMSNAANNRPAVERQKRSFYKGRINAVHILKRHVLEIKIPVDADADKE